MIRKTLIVVSLLSVFFVSPINAFADETINWANVCDGPTGFGRSGDIALYAQYFVPSAAATGATFHIPIRYYAGAFPDGITLSIEGNNAGEPDGIVIASYTAPGASIPVGGYPSPSDTIDFTFTGISLSGSTEYWAVLSRDGTLQPPNDFPLACADSASNVSKYQLDGDSTWTSLYYLYGSVDLTSGGGGGSGTSTSETLTTPEAIVWIGSAMLAAMIATGIIVLMLSL